ncbi:hypothetical protein ACRAVF_04555 [Bradyrhizobium oligotrophicum S58]
MPTIGQTADDPTSVHSTIFEKPSTETRALTLSAGGGLPGRGGPLRRARGLQSGMRMDGPLLGRFGEPEVVDMIKGHGFAVSRRAVASELC